MADGLAGRLGVLGLGTGGASASGGGGAGSRWPGDAGMSFCLHRIDVEPKVAQAQAKGWSPAQQFGVIAAQILPMSPGARVHDVVVRALDPFIRAALQGLPIGVEALVISTLEHLRTGSVHVTGTVDVQVPAAPAAAPAGPAMDPATFMLAARAYVTFDAQHADDPARLAALLAIATAPRLLSAIEAYPGHDTLKQLLRDSIPAGAAAAGAAAAAAAAAADPAAHAAANGWEHLADEQYAHPKYGVCAVRDMPTIKYWQTMARYCAAMSSEEVRQIKQLPLVIGANPVAYATRLSVMAQTVREARASNPNSADFPAEEEYAVFIRAVRGNTLYNQLYEQQEANIVMLPHAERTPVTVAERLRLAREAQQSLEAEQARLAAVAAVVEQQEVGMLLQQPQEVAQRPQQQSGGGYHIQHAGSRHVTSVVQGMTDKVRHSLLRAIVSETGV